MNESDSISIFLKKRLQIFFIQDFPFCYDNFALGSSLMFERKLSGDKSIHNGSWVWKDEAGIKKGCHSKDGHPIVHLGVQFVTEVDVG